MSTAFINNNILKLLTKNEKKEIRVVLPSGRQLGLMTHKNAMDAAKQFNIDLICINPKSDPPVCLIQNYGKWEYEQSKNNKSERPPEEKEIQLSVTIADGDLQHKLNHGSEFLKNKHRVKLSLKFNGREQAHPEIGFNIMNRALQTLSAYGKVIQQPTRTGRNIFAAVAPV